MANKYPFKLNGYIYSAGTKKGFLRMARMGIPRPPFAIENKIYKELKKQVVKTAINVLRDFSREVKGTGLLFKNGKLVTDSDKETLHELLDFFDEMGKKEIEHNKFINEMQLSSIGTNLQERWAQEADMNDELTDEDESQLTMALNNFFKKDQEEVIEELDRDAGPNHKGLTVSFSLDKRKIFEKNMDDLRELYITNSLNRIRGEQESIKRKFLTRLTDYAEGRSDKLIIRDVMDEIMYWGDNMARMFARDQMARFNKAVTLSQFRAAGVTKVKWITSHDIRVRDTHKKLDGQIFDVNRLPEELNDYNCRCGLVPVEYAD